MLGGLGQQPLAWPLPNGYPDVVSAWQSAGGTLARDAVSSLVPATLPAAHGVLVSALWQRLHYRRIRLADRDALCRFLGVTAATPLTPSSDVLENWLLVPLVSLVLDAPSGVQR